MADEWPENAWLLLHEAKSRWGRQTSPRQVEYTRADLAAERERKLVVALDQAAQALDWAARKMKGRCTGTAVDAAMVAAGNATAVREELGYE